MVASKGMLQDRARGMRKQPSQAERALWKIVGNRQVLGAKFRRQHPIENYIADLASVDAKLVIEVDGRSHDNSEQRSYDEQRIQRLNELGWRVLIVRNDDVLAHISVITGRIAAALRATPSP